VSWLAAHLRECPLTEEVEGYLLGRGTKAETVAETGFCTWQELPEPAPDPHFRKMAGACGEYLRGRLITPVHSPPGDLIGIEARDIHEKRILDYRLAEAAWNPFFLGMQRAMPKIWKGGDAWITEGQFDLSPMEWVVPETAGVLATVRAYLSKQHIEFLRRFCKGWVHMVYDRDEAGRKGTYGWVDQTGRERWGAVQQLKRVGLKHRVVAYSGGTDPGDVWDSGGIEAMRAAFSL